jgi:hypothetical protein
MKILLILLVAIAVIVAVFLIVGIFIKQDYTIERDIIIEKSKSFVFNYIKLLRNQHYFNKWTMTDPNAKMDYRGIDGTVGFVMAWDSNNKQVGKGEQEIKKIDDGERIDFEIRFLKPFKNTSFAYMITDSLSSNQTRIKWVFEGRMKYPLNIMHLFIDFSKLLGKDIETSLYNLKSLLEK